MNCFNCEMEKSCKSCLDLISQKKTYSTDINMLKKTSKSISSNASLLHGRI